MFLAYDVLQLRASSLSNKLFIQRQNWTTATADIADLTEDQIRDALNDLESHRKIDDPVIRRLLYTMQTIAMRVPGSFAQKLRLRAEIRGLIVRYGMPAFWVTINPSDLRNPLVLILAGIPYSGDIFSAANSAIREATATSNPVAVAEFFHHVCEAIFDGLLASNTGQIGIVGDVSNHYGVVETNGRGMLHLHALVWVRGNLAFNTLRNRVLEDAAFGASMVSYLEKIIIQSIDENIPLDPEVNLPLMPPSARDVESDHDFYLRLSHDSNLVARQKQMHSQHHFATCFKYRTNRPNKDSCRFGMPRDLIPFSGIDELGVIHLARNHAWINPWNPAIATCLRSNHDISWIPTVAKSLSLIYYITNYAAKDDVSPWQMVAKAGLLKQALEKAKVADPPTAADLRLREKGMDDFALRCFNTLAHDREISGVQVASTLLRLPSYYTVNYNFVSVNLWWLRQYVRALTPPEALHDRGASNPLQEETCTYQAGDTAPVSLFDNYKWRGTPLASLTFFEYCMMLRMRSKRGTTDTDIEFDPAHPRYSTHTQRIAQTPAQVATVTFKGQLTQFQTDEDSIPGGHPQTDAILNDLAEILLGLFVPWHDLSAILSQFPTTQNTYCRVWTVVEPTLAPHNREFAANIDLLRKSKEDCHTDAKLRRSAYKDDDFFDRHVADLDQGSCGSDNDDQNEISHSQNENFTAETLITAYHSIKQAWDRESFITARKIPALLRETTQGRNTSHINPRQLPNSASEASGVNCFPTSLLQNWQCRLKSLAATNHDDPTTAQNDSSFQLDDFGHDIGDGFLQPTLIDSDVLHSAESRHLQLRENPTANSLISLLSEDIPLNEKQKFIVHKVLSEALTWADHPYDSSRRKQLLLCITGEGGTGKSQIPKAVVAAMDILGRREEIMLMAPTGAAADTIGGNTYHTSLGISINRLQKTAMNSRVKRLWAHKTIMFIDEMSMMDLSMLSVVNNHCRIARSMDRSSPDLFGGLPVVILMGDFFQFPPVRGPALWKEPRENNDEDENGRMIWHRFQQAVILDEQMRQSEDPSFRHLLSRARLGTLTPRDVDHLNTKAIHSLVDPHLGRATTVVKLNSVRQQINRTQLEHFARTRSQPIWIFPASHTRTKPTDAMTTRLKAEDLLKQTDQGTKIPFPGLFLYSRNMPAVMLTNVCTRIGQVNGAAGTAVGVVLDPAGKCCLSQYKISDTSI